MIESDQLRRTYEGEVHRPEEQDGRFAVQVLLEVEVFNDFAIAEYGSCGEVRGLTSYQDHNYSCNRC
ncbi:hypothetical protein D3C86_2192470 [compost metagenome]